MKIVPRGAAGWRAFALWMAAFGVILAGFFAVMAAIPEPAGQTAVVIVFLAATLVWTIAMIRWMLARSEVVDLRELLEIKRQRERTRS